MDRSAVRAALDRLARADRLLDEQVGPRASLDPDRRQARRLVELGEELLPMVAPSEAFARGLAEIGEAFARHFPDNIFWDLDRVAAELSRRPDADQTVAFAGRFTALAADFGRYSAIRFRYAHDFLFGFDWCRWVAKDPARHAAVGPFQPKFFDYLDQRQRELLELIASGDRKYGPLGQGDFRNPFFFSRDPEAEQRLHRALAERDLIPVQAWRLDGTDRWQRPYADLREALAAEIGVARRPTRSS